MSDLDELLWWAMVLTGGAAAALSISVSWCDRRGHPSRRQLRFLLHMASYILLSVSILVFALRGFVGGL